MKILANDGVSQSGVDILTQAGFEVITTNVAQEQLVNYINENKITVLLVRSATTARKELIDACPGLKVIGRGGVGMDNIDVAYAREKRVERNQYASCVFFLCSRVGFCPSFWWGTIFIRFQPKHAFGRRIKL